MKKRAAFYLAGLLCCLCIYALGDRLARDESQRLAFADLGFAIRVPDTWLYEIAQPANGVLLSVWTGAEDESQFLYITATQEPTGESLTDKDEDELKALLKAMKEAGYEQSGTSRAGGVTFLYSRYLGEDGYPWITYTTWADGVQLRFDFSADTGGALFRAQCRQILSTFTLLS